VATSTRLGPWLVGTVKNTIGVVPGQIRNLGASLSVQTDQVSYIGAVFNTLSTTRIAVLPQGAQIVQIYVDTQIAFTGSTAANLTIGTAASNALFMATTDITAQGRAANTGFATKLNAWSGASATSPTLSPDGVGVGNTVASGVWTPTVVAGATSADVIVNAYLTPTLANVTAGLVQFTILYTVRNVDGTIYPSSTNNAFVPNA